MAGEFVTYDSRKIYFQSWPVDHPSAVIQILHGLGEMEAYYRHSILQEIGREEVMEDILTWMESH